MMRRWLLVALGIGCGGAAPERAGEDMARGADIHTSLGVIHCELWPDVAPQAVQTFAGLATGARAWTDPRTGRRRDDPLYDGTVFHRVVPDTLIAGGDPLGTGEGGPGFRLRDEIVEEVRFDRPGLLAMTGNGRPNSGGSAFFITTPGSMPWWLDGKRTIFGRCDLEVVAKVASQDLRMRGPDAEPVPVEPVVIERIEIRR